MGLSLDPVKNNAFIVHEFVSKASLFDILHGVKPRRRTHVIRHNQQLHSNAQNESQHLTSLQSHERQAHMMGQSLVTPSDQFDSMTDRTSLAGGTEYGQQVTGEVHTHHREQTSQDLLGI